MPTSDMRAPEFNLGLDPRLAAPIRTLKILIGALLGGWILSAVIVIAVAHAMPGPPPSSGMTLTYAGVIVAAGGLLMRRLVDHFLIEARLRGISSARRSSIGGAEEIPEDARLVMDLQLLSVMRQWLVVRTAILEAASFFLVVVYFIERSPWSLALAAMLILPAVAQFPTAGGIRLWLERRRRALAARREQMPKLSIGL
jgi:hypothetical protein